MGGGRSGANLSLTACAGFLGSGLVGVGCTLLVEGTWSLRCELLLAGRLVCRWIELGSGLNFDCMSAYATAPL